MKFIKGVLEMWYKVSDKNDEVAFFSDCTQEQAEALLQKKIDSCKRELKLEKLPSKPEGIVLYGCTRVDVPQKNVFVELFVLGGRKWRKRPAVGWSFKLHCKFLVHYL